MRYVTKVDVDGVHLSSNRPRKAARRPRPRQLEAFRKGVRKLLAERGAICNQSDVARNRSGRFGPSFRAWTEYGELLLHFDTMDDGYCLTVFARFEDHVVASRHIAGSSGKWNFHSTANAKDALAEFTNQLDSVKFLGRPPPRYRVRYTHARVMDLVRNATGTHHPHPPRAPAYAATRSAVARLLRQHRRKPYFWYIPDPTGTVACLHRTQSSTSP